MDGSDTSTSCIVCQNCGKKLPADSLFCQYCGKALEKIDIPNEKRVFDSLNDVEKNLELKQEKNEQGKMIDQKEYERVIVGPSFQAEQIIMDGIQQQEKSVKVARIRKIIAIVMIAIIAIVAAGIYVTKSTKESVFNGHLRNMATDAMDENYTNVYADVVSIEPWYFIYEYNTTRSGAKVGNKEISEVVCKCKTVEGKAIWASIFYQYYPGWDYWPDDEEMYQPQTYSMKNPVRIVGYINTARQVIEELEDEIGDVFVLDVREKVKDQNE